jgi:homocysteine S-methyltransferase
MAQPQPPFSSVDKSGQEVAYTPEEALPPAASEQFHAPQLEALAEAQVDFLYAATLPALSEARGIAAAMAKQGLPYILSFVIRRDGALLDGTPLAQAIETIDRTAPRSPTGYAVNCVYPTVFSDGLAALERQSPALTKRILSYQANTSAKDPKELDGLGQLEQSSPKYLRISCCKHISGFAHRFWVVVAARTRVILSV